MELRKKSWGRKFLGSDPLKSQQQFLSRSESVERDGAEFFGQQGLDEEYGAGESQGVSLGLKALVVN